MTAAAGWKRADAAHHDREAERYDRLIGREFAPYQTLFTAVPWAQRVAAEGGDLVLDVGGGTGQASVPIAAAGLAAVLLDRSRGMLRQARRSAQRAGTSRIFLVVGDAERLPFGAGAFCGVICEGVLHHLPDVDVALGEADRVLRPGGSLCLAEPDAAGSALSRAVRGLARVLGPTTEALSRYKSPAAAHERPLRSAHMVARLEGLGYQTTALYLVHPPLLYRFIPPSAAMGMARALNRGAARRRSGDLVVINARKPGGPR